VSDIGAVNTNQDKTLKPNLSATVTCRGRIIPCELKDNGDRTYTVQYTPPTAGMAHFNYEMMNLM
jgi:hypothetical protein